MEKWIPAGTIADLILESLERNKKMPQFGDKMQFRDEVELALTPVLPEEPSIELSDEEKNRLRTAGLLNKEDLTVEDLLRAEPVDFDDDEDEEDEDEDLDEDEDDIDIDDDEEF